MHDDCLSLQGQWQTLQQQEAQDVQRAAEIQAQFDTALQASIFADRDAFVAALLDEETFNRLEQLKQSLEGQRQQAQTLLNQAQQALATHQQQLPTGWISRSPCNIFTTRWRNSPSSYGEHHSSGRNSPAAQAGW